MTGHILTDVTGENDTELKRGESREILETYVPNPFTSNTKTEFSRVRLRNSRSGETVLSGHIVKELDKQIE